jgi:hypothetical protein
MVRVEPDRGEAGVPRSHDVGGPGIPDHDRRGSSEARLRERVSEDARVGLDRADRLGRDDQVYVRFEAHRGELRHLLLLKIVADDHDRSLFGEPSQ